MTDNTQEPIISGAPPRTGELVASIVVTLLGAGLTVYGAFAHVHALPGPGSALILLGSAWLGNVLARRGVRLLPAPNFAEAD